MSSVSCCGTTPSRARMPGPSRARVAARGRCSSPSVGGETQPIIRIVEDLPAPLGPRKPNASPRWISTSMPSTAVNSPKRFTSPRARTMDVRRRSPACCHVTIRQPRSVTLASPYEADRQRRRHADYGDGWGRRLITAHHRSFGTSRSATGASHTSRGSSARVERLLRGPVAEHPSRPGASGCRLVADEPDAQAPVGMPVRVRSPGGPRVGADGSGVRRTRSPRATRTGSPAGVWRRRPLPAQEGAWTRSGR